MYITDFRPGSKAMDCCSEKQRLLQPMLFGTLNRKGLLSHTQMGKNIYENLGYSFSKPDLGVGILINTRSSISQIIREIRH